MIERTPTHRRQCDLEHLQDPLRPGRLAPMLFANTAAFTGDQPSNDTLVDAYNAFAAGQLTASALRGVRDRRSSWLGRDENALRRIIDGALSEAAHA